MNFEAGRRMAPRYTSIFKLGNRIQRVRRVLLALDACSIADRRPTGADPFQRRVVTSLSSFQFFFLYVFSARKNYRQSSETESCEISIYYPRTILLDRLGKRLNFRLIARFRTVAVKTSGFRRFRTALPLNYLFEY